MLVFPLFGGLVGVEVLLHWFLTTTLPGADLWRAVYLYVPPPLTNPKPVRGLYDFFLPALCMGWVAGVACPGGRGRYAFAIATVSGVVWPLLVYPWFMSFADRVDMYHGPTVDTRPWPILPMVALANGATLVGLGTFD